MKKITGLFIAVLMIAALLAGCGNERPPAGDTGSTSPTTTAPPPAELSGIVKTGGSTSVEKVMTALIFQFEEDNGKVTVEYEGNGSGDGIKNTISGLYAVGHSSRELKTDGSEDGLTAIPYAIDGIAVVINKQNGVENLTKEQIKDIYTGKITKWSEVGGADELITVITRESGSGTRSAFAEIVGIEKKDDDDTKLVENANEADSTGAVQTHVSANANAIGYMSFSDVDDSKVSIVKYEGVEISTGSLKDNSYKLKREFYLLTKDGETLKPEAQAFIDFVLSGAGQAIVADKNLLPVK